MTAKKIVEGLREREFVYRQNSGTYEASPPTAHSTEATSYWSFLVQAMKEAADYIEAKEKQR